MTINYDKIKNWPFEAESKAIAPATAFFMHLVWVLVRRRLMKANCASPSKKQKASPRCRSWPLSWEHQDSGCAIPKAGSTGRRCCMASRG